MKQSTRKRPVETEELFEIGFETKRRAFEKISASSCKGQCNTERKNLCQGGS